jgi:hypothetical protein
MYPRFSTVHSTAADGCQTVLQTDGHGWVRVYPSSPTVQPIAHPHPRAKQRAQSWPFAVSLLWTPSWQHTWQAKHDDGMCRQAVRWFTSRNGSSTTMACAGKLFVGPHHAKAAATAVDARAIELTHEEGSDSRVASSAEANRVAQQHHSFNHKRSR